MQRTLYDAFQDGCFPSDACVMRPDLPLPHGPRVGSDRCHAPSNGVANPELRGSIGWDYVRQADHRGNQPGQLSACPSTYSSIVKSFCQVDVPPIGMGGNGGSVTHMDRRRSLDPIGTETQLYLDVRVADVLPLINRQEDRGWRVRQITRDSSRSWLVVYEVDL